MATATIVDDGTWQTEAEIPEKERYARYMTSREWALRKAPVKERSGGICERCKINPSDAVHHLSYARKYHEEPEDLQDICEACHKFTHGKSDVDPAIAGAWLGPLTGILKTEERLYFFFTIQRTSVETCECVHQCWSGNTRNTFEMLAGQKLDGVSSVDLTDFIGHVYALWTSDDPMCRDCVVERMRPMDGPDLLDSPKWCRKFFVADWAKNRFPETAQ